MTTSTVWAVFHDHNDEVAAGPFATAEEANAHVAGFDDVYAAQVKKVDFDRNLAEIEAKDGLPWYATHSNLAFLVEYLAEVGWTGRELADVVSKPWGFKDEYDAARAGLDPADTESGL